VDVVAEIHEARDCGVVHCGLSAQPSPALAELASEFELAADPANYWEIDAAAARRLAELILNQDMAYNSEIMPPSRASELADRFLAQFGTHGVRFYTNGTFHEGRGPKLGSPSAGWNPVTAATFDTGILVIGRHRSGCLWVEDED
jgi:hypothetical protein